MKSLRLFLIIVVVILTGCSGRAEVNDLAVVTAAGLDRIDENTLMISVQLTVPQVSSGGQQQAGMKGGGGNRSTIVRSARGVTAADAVSTLDKKLPRRLFWGQMEVLVIGEELAKAGVRDQLDFFSRHPATRITMIPFICQGRAHDILTMRPVNVANSAQALHDNVQLSMKKPVTLNEMMELMGSDAGSVALPLIGPLPSAKENPFIQGRAIIKDDHLVGVVNNKLSQGIVWLRNEIVPTVVTVKLKEAGYVSLYMLKSKTTLTPHFDRGKWRMNVKIEAVDDLYQNASSLNVGDLKVTSMIQQTAEKEIEARLKKTLQHVQGKIKADIFGFGEAFHRKYPQEWSRVKDHWDDVFPQVEVVVNASVIIKRTGVKTSPPGIPEQEVKKQ